MSDQVGDSRFQESIYTELHGIAERALARELPGHSLQPTLLVNDAYLKLLQQKNVNVADRPQVLAVGATIIRRLLVDYARRRKAKKRGGDQGRGVALNVCVSEDTDRLDILELNDALDVLSERNPRVAQVVELKFFGGLSGSEIAERLDVSLRTVHNDWQYAKAWLYRQLSSGSTSASLDP